MKNRLKNNKKKIKNSTRTKIYKKKITVIGNEPVLFYRILITLIYKCLFLVRYMDIHYILNTIASFKSVNEYRHADGVFSKDKTIAI